jgi:hypothetical protein
MLERVLIFAVLLSVFLVGFVNALMNRRRVTKALRRIRQLDPRRGSELAEFGGGLGRLFVPFHPAKFNEFLRSGDDLGDAELAEHLRRLRSFPKLVIASWLAVVLVMLALVVLAALR